MAACTQPCRWDGHWRYRSRVTNTVLDRLECRCTTFLSPVCLSPKCHPYIPVLFLFRKVQNCPIAGKNDWCCRRKKNKHPSRSAHNFFISVLFETRRTATRPRNLATTHPLAFQPRPSPIQRRTSSNHEP